MQSDDEPSLATAQPQEHRIKRRRLHGACDTCRRKKIKCKTRRGRIRLTALKTTPGNSAEMPNKICSNCIAYNLECTHNIPRHASKKETEKGYIQALEERLDKMEQLLRQVRPELDIEQSVAAASSPESAHSASTPQSAAYSRSTPVTDLPYPAPQTLSDSVAFHASPATKSNDLSDEEDLAHISLSEQLGRLAIGSMEDKFFGKSSGLMLVRQATNVRQETTGMEVPSGRYLRRPSFWDLRSWEAEYVNSDIPQFVFPEKDLLDQLMSLYFDHVNIYMPLLHRPTFERNLANDLHLHDVGFAQVVLMVCALASRFTDDPRVLLPGDKTGLSSGFKYFSQTRLLRNKLLEKASLYDLQYYCLVVPYFVASSMPQAAWNLVGLALRLAQERGIHRRRGEGYKPTAVDELWKRCFWSLISFDRISSSFVGRSCAMQDEDFDVEFPIECDDEYWECRDSEQNWKQPPGKPSTITAFNQHLRLCEILAFALRTLYSTKKSRMLTGLIGDQWEQRIVTELDSSMNRWKDSLPDHLRWDPNQENTVFLQQSANIHTMFYYLQIQIHRPFIHKSSPLSFPSLAICTNAARACSHLVDAKGSGWINPFPQVIVSAFASGIVLLLHMYGGRRAGLNMDQEKEMKDIQRCMDTLRANEKRWHVAGRLFDMLTEIAAIHEGQLPDSKLSSHKRPRDDIAQHEQGSGSTSNPVRLVKPLPARQPKGWPPTPPVPGHKSEIKTDHEPKSAAPSSDPGATPLGTMAQTPSTFYSGSQLSGPRLPQPNPGSIGSDWDLGHLLLAQMNFGAPPSSGGSASRLQDYSSGVSSNLGDSPATTSLSNHELFNMPGTFIGQTSIPPVPPYITHNQVFDINQDMTALWSDAPSNFNIEEWDRFVTSMNVSTGLWPGANTDLNNYTHS